MRNDGRIILDLWPLLLSKTLLILVVLHGYLPTNRAASSSSNTSRFVEMSDPLLFILLRKLLMCWVNVGEYWVSVEWVLSECWWVLGECWWVLGECWVSVGECWVSVGWVLGECWVSVGWVLGECWVSVGWVLGECWVSVGWVLGECWVSVGWVLGECWVSVEWVLSECWWMAGELVKVYYSRTVPDSLYFCYVSGVGWMGN